MRMHKKIVALILTFNEEVHIKRCIENVKDIVDEIYVLDSISTDNTERYAIEAGAKVIHRRFDTYSSQINWALEQLRFKCDYILRIDADEVLDPLLKNSIQIAVRNNQQNEIHGWMVNRRFIFLGKELIYGGLRNIKVIRIVDPKKTECNSRIMDEKFIVNGKVGELKGKILDWNLKPFSEWLIKHVKYSMLEAKQFEQSYTEKEKKKKSYYLMPPFIRALLYFVLRYFILLGFLDGRAGYVFHLFQCFFYRNIVDVEIMSSSNVKKNKYK